jgi:integrase
MLPGLIDERGGEQLRRIELADSESLNPHLNDCIVAALETGMRKAAILSLQWKQVRWLQNDLRILIAARSPRSTASVVTGANGSITNS